MKFIILALAMLLAISFVAAHNPQFPVSIQHKLVGSWNDGSRGGEVFAQFDITVTNDGQKNIKQIVIGTDATCRLRDSTSIWNVQVIDGPFVDFLILPSYQDINAGASYTFGYIIHGTAQANLFVKSVIYA
ncbi:cellulose-binding domain-containing protein [Cavenderia fasciculata]|uniref:Cellulose-binding domain-containing protein n=1 Tax=Cavenderia fasciculata TaxID=261658 RepID=F4PPX1_CACFS|nr:cellulose-binding domain-containing protein [Cavenderia fasciculata]EGG22434.1 cellulose-binding domain-containing protein [Cavenderia fasciculata]|eukprot:XP_004360285.1 cellulose-binding domain-containing protein [Cavenderia fasciculata]